MNRAEGQRDFAPGSPPDWSFFDRVYCISLVNREDRRAAARVQFARVGLAERVEFFLVEKDRENPERGIYESHILCLNRALAEGARHILLFEDDVVFARFSADRLARMIAFLRAHEWDAFFPGCIASRLRKVPAAPVARARYRCLSHSYAVNRDFAAHLARRPWAGTAYDDFLREQTASFAVFAACPMFAFQSDAPSDNDAWLHLDRRRRRLGGLMFLQKVNEFRLRFFWPIVLLHGVVFGALAALLWRLWS